jgi:hypothetical protein
MANILCSVLPDPIRAIRVPKPFSRTVSLFFTLSRTHRVQFPKTTGPNMAMNPKQGPMPKNKYSGQSPQLRIAMRCVTWTKFIVPELKTSNIYVLYNFVEKQRLQINIKNVFY